MVMDYILISAILIIAVIVLFGKNTKVLLSAATLFSALIAIYMYKNSMNILSIMLCLSNVSLLFLYMSLFVANKDHYAFYETLHIRISKVEILSVVVSTILGGVLLLVIVDNYDYLSEVSLYSVVREEIYIESLQKYSSLFGLLGFFIFIGVILIKLIVAEERDD